MKKFVSYHTIIEAILAIPDQRSATSFAIAPFIIVPFGFPFSSFKITAALSSNFILSPFNLLYSFLCLTIIAGTTCPFSPGFPFTIEALTISPIPAAGNLPFVVFRPLTENILISLAPELSHTGTFASKFNALVILAVNAFIFSIPLLSQSALFYILALSLLLRLYLLFLHQCKGGCAPLVYFV